MLNSLDPVMTGSPLQFLCCFLLATGFFLAHYYRNLDFYRGRAQLAAGPGGSSSSSSAMNVARERDRDGRGVTDRGRDRERERERARVDRDRDGLQTIGPPPGVVGPAGPPSSSGGGHGPLPPPPPPGSSTGPGVNNGPPGVSGPGVAPGSGQGPPPGVPGGSISVSGSGGGGGGPHGVVSAGPSQAQGGGGGGFFEDLDPLSVPPELKKEGSDWFAVFNPKAKRVLDVNLVHTLMHESVVCCVRFLSNGRFLTTGCNRTAQIYDTKTGTKVCVLVDESAGKAGDLYIRSVCFSPDGKYLATSAEDKHIRIWDIANKRIRNVFDGHQQEIYSLDFSLDGRLIVSGSGDKTARIWDMHDGTSKVLTINDPDSVNNDVGVTSVAISPDGQLVAAGSLDTVVRIWDVATAQLVEILRGHRDSVYSVAFTPDGKGLVSGSLDKTLKYWDVSGLIANAGSGSENKRASSGAGSQGNSSGAGTSDGGGQSSSQVGQTCQCTTDFIGHKDYVLSVAVSHDGAWVVSGSKDRCVRFWDSRSGIVQCMLQAHENSVMSIALSPVGNVLATGSGDGRARIWSYNSV